MNMQTIRRGRSAFDGQTRIEAKWVLSGCLPPHRSLSQIPVDSASFVIGRRPESNLKIESQLVSGRHAEILLIGDGLFIRDLNSTNGTYLNRRKVETPTPISVGDHIQIADVEFRLDDNLEAKDTRERLNNELKKTDLVIDAFRDDWILSQFDELICRKAITPHFQPIVDLRTDDVVGFEALARSRMVGLENPLKMFQVAEMVNRQIELSLACRERAIFNAKLLELNFPIFVNTHPSESMMEDVIPSVRKLRQNFPTMTIVVELHEKAIENPERVQANSEELREIGAQVAYDDFGAGQSRLIELMKAPPDYLKFDASLIRDLHGASDYQRQVLKMLIETARSRSIVCLAEGVETEAESDACREIGFDLGQGYYFGYPDPNPSTCELQLPFGKTRKK